MKARSLRLKLTLWFAVTFALILFVSDLITYRGLANIMESEVDSNLASMASMESTSFLGSQTGTGDAMVRLAQLFPRSFPQYVQVVEASGEVVRNAGITASPVPLIDKSKIASVLAGNPMRGSITVDGKQLRISALSGNSGDKKFVVIAATNTDTLFERENWIVFTLALIDVVTLAVSIAVGYILIGRALRPVDHITERARAIGAGDLHQRLETVDSSLEMARLTAVLNEMFDKLQRLFESQRQLIQDASHEIRSPLAAIRCRLEVALRQQRPAEDYRNVIESCLLEVERMTALAEDIFLLARADSNNLALDLREVSIRQVLTGVRDELIVLAEERSIDLKLDVAQDCYIYGDRSCLHRVFRNIVENAVKYTPSGGRVKITAKQDGEHIKTDVEDTGVGIPPDELPNIFRRFYRVDPARSRGEGGAGLGLAICDQIVLAHGGRIDVDSTPGKGSRFTILLTSAEALLDKAAV